MRLPRLYAPGLPQLVLSRFSPVLSQRWQQNIPAETFDLLSSWLSTESRTEGIRLHAWSLTPSDLRLIATPPHRQSISRLIQALGRRLGANFRDGPVFSGRYRSCLLEPAAWVMPATHWIELAAFDASYTQQPRHWRWSSAGDHCGSTRGPLNTLSFHHDYWVCGNTPFERQVRHQTALEEGLMPEQRARIEAAIHGQWALGSETFIANIVPVASRRVAPAQRGRPRQKPPASKPD